MSLGALCSSTPYFREIFFGGFALLGVDEVGLNLGGADVLVG